MKKHCIHLLCIYYFVLFPFVPRIATEDATISIEGRNIIASTDDNFVCATLDWWPPEKCDYGTCSWGLASVLNLNLSNSIFLNSVKAFSPLKIRVGGSLQDRVFYDQQPCNPFVSDPSHTFGFSDGCLPFHRWDELNYFFNKSGALIIFGLNALNGRVPQSDGSMAGPWNYSNAASLIRYSVSKDYAIHGWELGNELSGSGIGTRVNVDEYSSDVINLKTLVNSIYQDKPFKPLVLAPGGFFDPGWYGVLLNETKPNNLDVITHHIYNLGPGFSPADSEKNALRGSNDHLIDEILDPVYLEGCASVFANTQALIKKSGTNAVAWVGEAGGAYNSGRNLVTNAFVFSFWYLDQLGMSAKYDTKTYCRQTLIGGNYGLLNTTTFEPNPDYYSALLWHRLMGRNVLSLSFTGSKMIRAYAHCAKPSKGITILLINLSGNTSSPITVTNGTNSVQILQREEYHLTPQNGDLHSQIMLLNGKILFTDSNGNIPIFEPIKAQGIQPLVVNPYSIVFAHIPSFFAPACT